MPALPLFPFVAVFLMPLILLAWASMFLAAFQFVHSTKADEGDAQVSDALLIDRCLSMFEAAEEAIIAATIDRCTSIMADRRVKRAIATAMARHIDRVVDPSDVPSFEGFTGSFGPALAAMEHATLPEEPTAVLVQWGPSDESTEDDPTERTTEVWFPVGRAPPDLIAA